MHVHTSIHAHTHIHSKHMQYQRRAWRGGFWRDKDAAFVEICALDDGGGVGVLVRRSGGCLKALHVVCVHTPCQSRIGATRVRIEHQPGQSRMSSGGAGVRRHSDRGTARTVTEVSNRSVSQTKTRLRHQPGRSKTSSKRSRPTHVLLAQHSAACGAAERARYTLTPLTTSYSGPPSGWSASIIPG